ncbi:MAG: TIGR02996 domain-containing protein [Myxococcota bacterium]
MSVRPAELDAWVAKHFAAPLDAVWVGDDIPARKARNARASHAVPDDERLLVLYDDTLFGGASDGVVITTVRLSVKELLENPRAVRWDHLVPGDVAVDGNTLRVGGLVLSFQVWTPEHAERFAAFVRDATTRTRRPSEWMPAALLSVVRNRFGADDDAYFAPSIPAHKEANVRALYGLPADEPVLALLDDTVFGSAKHGWVMTLRRFASCQSFGSPRQAGWLEVLDAPVEADGPGVRVAAFFHEPLKKARVPVLVDTLVDLRALRDGLDPREPTLEARIAAHPDEDDAFAVLADWLLEQGHPRGLLQGPADPAVLRDHAPELGLLGWRDDVAEVTWRWGWWDTLTLYAPSPSDEPDALRPDACAAQVLRHPSARFVRTLVLGGERPLDPGRVEPLLAAVRAVDLPCLQRLEIHAPGAYVSDTLDLSRYPHLREAVLDVSRVHPEVERAVASLRAR